MHAWLKRAVAGLLSAGTLLGGGLLMAGTANADEIRMPDIGKTITSLTASAATTYPRELVNGGFDYLPDGGWKTVDAPSYMTNAYTSVDPNNGQYMRNAKHSDADLASWVDWPGFDQSKFAWKTDQKGGHDQGGLKDRAEAVELQQDSMDGNTYAEMVASEPGRTIYQNLATIPGTLYKIRLKHTSLCKDNVDQMQVVINGTPIEMTRVAANGKAGDKVGEKSKTIGTRVTNENRWHHSDQWETYEGYYVIPDGQTTTRFGFKAVNYLDPTKGNLLDDVTFARAYKLSYDKNASDATGKVPSDETAGAVKQAAQKARDLQAAADEAQKAYDEAVKANEDKAKALEEARKDQADKNAAYSAAQQATKEARSGADAATDAQTAAQTAVDKANTAVAAAQAKIDTADKLTQTAAKNKTDAEAAIKQANTDKTKAAADLAAAKAAKAEAEKAKQAALDAKTVSDAKVEAAAKQVKAADEAIADAKAAYAKAKDDLNAATGKLNDAQNTIKRLQNAEENLKKANAKLTEAQSKLDEANKAKDEADKAYEKAKADYDAKLADKQASDKELAAAKQAEAEARKKAEEEAKKQQEAQKKADQAKKDAEAKKQKAEQAKKQAAGVTNNGLASTGSDTTAIATLAAIMTIAGAGCVLVKVRSAKHADGWHAVED